jgi:glycosyltransferase involved in cell wall biosynthesis
VIHAASNHEAAIPALIAARRLGIPFAYEVRGLWEYTAASRIPDWEQTERFALDRRLETLAASQADQVFTLTRALADELAARGVDAGRIGLAPNGVDPAAFPEVARDPSLAESVGIAQSPFTVGYVGSVVAYEGLDDLVAAFAQVANEVKGARLLVVGDGDALPGLRAQARALGLEAVVAFLGKVPPAEVPRYFALLDAVALPRKPVKVCELVSPLKPLEAMAVGVPLVVSDVGALREMVRPNETALVHHAGDVSSLAESLLRLATDRQLAARLAEAARRDALANRTWDRVVAGICRSYEKSAGPAAPARAGGRATGAVAAAPAGAFAPVPLPPGRSSMTAAEKALLDERLSAALAAGGVEGMEFLLARQTEGRSPRFAAFCQVKAAAAALAGGHEVDAVRLADAALGLDAGLATVRGAARVYHNAARLGEAGRLVERLVAMQDTLGDGDRRFVEEVRGRMQLAAWAEEPPASRRIPVVPGRVLNLLAFSLPYTSVGYATRSHGLAVGIRNAGWDIRPYTRPGFPYDFRPELEGQALPEHDEIDGITYGRIFETERRGRTEVDYLVAAIRLYEGVIAREQPQVVHAASNYVTALPALIAARRLGVPFVYEVRGFWEVTRSSRDEVFENTPKYRFMQLYESLVARHADRVVTITTAMKEELVARGVREDAISIAYNSVDPDRFVPRPPDRALADRLGIPEGVPVIGYIGSFVDYEGLDDLVTAAGELMRAGHDFRLLLVGDGAALEALRTQVAALGLAGRSMLTGRVPFEQVDDYYSLIDVAPFPRKPWKVCEMVSPLKPFEAMALQKAVVVSGTRALTEIVEHGRNGLVFEKGNVAHLAELLRDLILDPQRRRSLGEAAREWITSVRSWDAAGRVCGEAYEDAIRRAHGASGGEGFERGTAVGAEGSRRVEVGA